MMKTDHRAQLDTLFFEDVQYAVLDSGPTFVFDPTSHGVPPYEADPRSYMDSKPFSFLCAFLVKERALYLKWLGIRSANKRYPLINGRRAVSYGKAIEGLREEAPFVLQSQNARVYLFPEFKLDFTGTIRIAREWAGSSIGSWLRDESAYRHVLELTLSGGIVIAARDLTDRAN